MLCSAAPGPPPAGHVSPRICNDCVRRENNNQWTLGYECPGWTYGRHGYRSAPLVFSPRTPKPESLVGTYDVVYFAADQRFGPRIHRRAGGTLVLSPASDREDAALSSWRHSDIDADTDSDGTVTLTELEAVDVSTLGYPVGTHTEITHLADFIALLVSGVGHVDGEGHCYVD